MNKNICRKCENLSITKDDKHTFVQCKLCISLFGLIINGNLTDELALDEYETRILNLRNALSWCPYQFEHNLFDVQK